LPQILGKRVPQQDTYSIHPYWDFASDWFRGFSKSKLVFGYKLHMSCSAGKMPVPLTAAVSTANVYDDPHM
jgi:hypothetical protein